MTRPDNVDVGEQLWYQMPRVERGLFVRAFVGMPLADLGLGARAHNALRRIGWYADVSDLMMAEEDIASVRNLGITSLREIDAALTQLFDRASRALPEQPTSHEQLELIEEAARSVTGAADSGRLWFEVPIGRRLPLAKHFLRAPLRTLDLPPDIVDELKGERTTATIGDLLSVDATWGRTGGVSAQSLTAIHERLVALAEYILDGRQQLARWTDVMAKLAQREDLLPMPVRQFAWPQRLIDACPGPQVESLATLGADESAALWSTLSAVQGLGAELVEELEALVKAPADRTDDEWAESWRERGIEVIPEGYVLQESGGKGRALSRVLHRVVSERRDETDWFILQHRHGLLDAERFTLQQLGDAYGLTRERIRQRENKALRVVRSWFDEPVAMIAPARLHPALLKALSALATLFDEVLVAPMPEAEFAARSESILGQHDEGINSLVLLLAKVGGISPTMPPRKDVASVWTGGDTKVRKTIKERVTQIHDALTERSSEQHTVVELAVAINEHVEDGSSITVAEVREFAPLCSTVEVLENGRHLGRYQGRFEYLRRRTGQVERILSEIGEPMHLSDIQRIINHRAALYGGRPVNLLNLSNQMSEANQVVPIGRSGFWVMADWPDIELGTVIELMERCLVENNRPMTQREIYDWVAARRPVRESSILLNATSDDRFARIDRERWGLGHWKEAREAAAWNRAGVAAFVANLFKERATKRLLYSVVLEALATAADVPPRVARGLLGTNPVIETEQTADGERYAHLQSDYRIRMAREGGRKRKSKALEHVRSVARRVLADQPSREMSLAELRDIVMKEVGIPSASVYSCVSRIDELETVLFADRPGKLVRWVGDVEEDTAP